MFWKVALGLLALLAVLWWSGVDFGQVKRSVTGMADGNAEAMTGRSDERD
jgi:hypothetical protein